MMMTELQILHDTARRLAHDAEAELRLIPAAGVPLPSVTDLRHIMRLIKSLVFPEFFGESAEAEPAMRTHYIGVATDELFALLREQIRRGLSFCRKRACREDSEQTARQMALDFIGELPRLRRLLLTDVEAIYRNDPAASNRGEVIFCYPGVLAMVHYRTAHTLLEMEIPVIPRIITELAHSQTGIDIHPGARIGEYFAIDHGTGIVIGQTCIIGNHVTIYQGVTLGSKNFSFNDEGHPENLPRHPIIEDNVTIYSNASVLGRITVGHDAVIGGNIWVTDNVPPYGRITQQKFRL